MTGYIFAWLKFTAVTVIVIGILFSVNVKITNDAEPPLFTARYQWATRGSPSYTMTIEGGWIVTPSTSLIITVHEKSITKTTLSACEKSSPNYSQPTCDIAEQSAMQPFTIDDLFDEAEKCTKETINALRRCPVFDSDHFQGFTDSHAMFAAGQLCSTYFGSGESLCTVEYEPYYGYPKRIAHSAPQFMDGFTGIDVVALDIKK